MRSTALTQDPLIWCVYKCGKGVSIMWFSCYFYFSVFYFNSFCMCEWVIVERPKITYSRIENRIWKCFTSNWICPVSSYYYYYYYGDDTFLALNISICVCIRRRCYSFWWIVRYCGPVISQLWRFKVHTVLVVICHMYNV